MDGFWRALGPILGRFWAEVGGQVGAQIDPKSIKKAIQNQMHFVIDFLIDLGGVKQKEFLVPIPRGGLAEAALY